MSFKLMSYIIEVTYALYCNIWAFILKDLDKFKLDGFVLKNF